MTGFVLHPSSILKGLVMIRRIAIGLPTLSLLLLAGMGCSKKNHQVTGTVTVDGSPRAQVRVMLTPTDGRGRDANGITDESGKFSIGTLAAGDGATPGEYKVTFVIAEDAPSTEESAKPD